VALCAHQAAYAKCVLNQGITVVNDPGLDLYMTGARYE
jgi:hypothetical protein